MIIVNQDKEEIINFENMRGLMVTDNSIVAVESFNDDEGRCLGEYKTEERAKKVFDELTRSLANDNPIYSMPED